MALREAHTCMFAPISQYSLMLHLQGASLRPEAFLLRLSAAGTKGDAVEGVGGTVSGAAPSRWSGMDAQAAGDDGSELSAAFALCTAKKLGTVQY